VDSFNVYDVADHLTSMTYPTDTSTEVLTYYYDAAGRVITASTPGQSYLVNTQYDRFGRVVQQSEAASISQNWVYGGASTQFRLQEIRVQYGAAVMQDFQYGPYDPNGNLRAVTDNNAAASYPYANATARDNDWSYTYDGVGRLATMQNPAWASAASPFTYDLLGNLTTRGDGTSGGLGLTPDASKPHQVKSSSIPGTTPVYQYDNNGSLSSRPDTDGSGVDAAQQVTYDMDGRVATVTVGTTIVSYLYDYTGARVARTVQQGTTVGLPTFYFGKLIDYDRATQTLTRHIYASGRRIAQSSVANSSLIVAQADTGGRLIMLARTLDEVTRGDGPTMNPLYPHYALAAEDAAKLAVLLLLTLLVLDRVPGRVRIGMFRRIRRGHVIVVIVIFGLSLTPLTCARPSHAWGGGGPPPPPPSFPVYFVHSDHLGSTTLLTCYKRPTAENCADGTAAQYFRYDAYGMMKAFTSTGTAVIAGSELTDHLYTGQRWEYRTRLYDYGARTYDPRIARFLTHDPVREYMNPYAYVAWNPVKFVDPTGMFSQLTFNMIMNAFGEEFAMRYAAMTGGVAQSGGTTGVGGFGGATEGAGVTGPISGIAVQAAANAAAATLFGAAYSTLKDFAQFGVKSQASASSGNLTAQATLGSDSEGSVSVSIGVVNNPGNAGHPDGYPLNAASLQALLRTSAELGRLVTVHGGQRTAAENAAPSIHGAANSYHTTVGGRPGDGTGVDFSVDGLSHHVVAQFVFLQGIFRGAGFNNVHVHGDLRPSAILFEEPNR
jgi:RHS repeat-associated protein